MDMQSFKGFISYKREGAQWDNSIIACKLQPTHFYMHRGYTEQYVPR
jgi:hypothetical protein